jgi:hypothetical protein
MFNHYLLLFCDEGKKNAFILAAKDEKAGLEMMSIEKIKPDIVQGKSDLHSCLVDEFKKMKINDKEIEEIFSLIPLTLHNSLCFLDGLIGLWRYKFGNSSRCPNTKKLLWGSHIWLPVHCLSKVLYCAIKRLDGQKLKDYMSRLADLEKHTDVLAEIIPILRLDQNLHVEFEVPGYGPGNTTIDLKIGPIEERLLLLEVKHRMKDLYHMMDRVSPQAEPQHDPSILFKSAEKKFNSSAPEKILQGVWISTYVAQEENKLFQAFNNLDSTKVHFAILDGDDMNNEGYILARKKEDEFFLRKHLHLKPPSRFTFIF